MIILLSEIALNNKDYAQAIVDQGFMPKIAKLIESKDEQTQNQALKFFGIYYTELGKYKVLLQLFGQKKLKYIMQRFSKFIEISTGQSIKKCRVLFKRQINH